MNVPVNPNATPEAAKLLAYLAQVSGRQIISGQHTQTIPMEEITYIENVTGRKPKLRCFPTPPISITRMPGKPA